ncbi:MAG TPA: cytochrome c-type biogenesis protein CcmH [Gaiellaceae bacterium]|nr:cytochrome c-type biogenesis protein CcmH [Gaiellaceae bacterium]
MRRAVALAAAAAFVVAAPGAWASGTRPKLPEIEGDYMCLLCKVPLDESSSPAANQERAVLRHLIGQGLTAGQIKNRMVADYGTDVLAAPPDSGFNILAWWLPIAGAVAGALVLAFGVWRWSRGRGEPPAGPTQMRLEPGLERRLDEELARFDG